MFKLSFYKNNKFLCLALLFNSGFYVHAATVVNVNQSSDTIFWQISGNSYAIEGVNLSVTGSENSSSSLSACTSSPLTCSFSFNNSSPSFNTSSLSDGSFSWQIEIIPAVSELDCSSAADVRDAQGGYQGLTGGGAPTVEALYIQCLRNSGIIPTDDQELVASGSFNIDNTSGLIVPIDTNPVPTDNIPPVALCQDVSIDGSSASCSVYADVNNGSFDSDGSIDLIEQSPDGPYSLGVTKVNLTVTDNSGDTASCSAVVTVTDGLSPEIQCPADNTMTPPTAPKTFTATANDTCSVPTTQVASYDCYRFNPHGKRINTNDSCVVSITNDSITVLETSGVDSFIDWTVEATDSEGNTSDALCTVEVLHPNS